MASETHRLSYLAFAPPAAEALKDAGPDVWGIETDAAKNRFHEYHLSLCFDSMKHQRSVPEPGDSGFEGGEST